MVIKLTDCPPNRVLLQAKEELDAFQDLYKRDDNLTLDYVCMDYPGAQSDRAYYMHRIEQFLRTNKTNKGKTKCNPHVLALLL